MTIVTQYLDRLQEDQKDLQEFIIPISTDPSSPFFWLMIGTLIYMIIKAIRQSRQEQEYRMSFKCHKLSGKKKDLCYAESRASMYRKLMLIASEGRTKCYLTKDPDKCRDKVDEIYDKMKKRYEDSKKRLKKLQ